MGGGASVQQNDNANDPKKKDSKAKEKPPSNINMPINRTKTDSSVKNKTLQTSFKDKSSSKKPAQKQKNVNKSLSGSIKLPNIGKKNDKSHLPQQKKSQSKGISLPLCLNNNQSAMVCISPKCNYYPFYCFQCVKDCEFVHHHSAKVLSVSCKQFIKKVANRQKRIQEIKKITKKYKKCLLNLQKTVDRYIEKEMQSLRQVEKRMYMSVDLGKIRNNLQKQKYIDMTGASLGQLWICFDRQFEQNQGKRIQTIQIRQQLTQDIRQCFSSINKLLINKKKEEKAPIVSSSGDKVFHPFKRYAIYNKVLDKERSWNSNIQQ